MADTLTPTAEERAANQVSPQWRTLLAGPVIWAAYFLVGYTVGEFGCAGGWLRGTLVGLPAASLVIGLLTLVSLVGAVWATLSAYRQWQSARHQDPRGRTEDDNRSHFMLLGGWVLGALFSFLILLTGIPAVVLPPCG